MEPVLPVKRVLSDLGFENVYIEPQQAVADGHFPTAPYPNPENPDAWELALKLAKEKDADLVLATTRMQIVLEYTVRIQRAGSM